MQTQIHFTLIFECKIANISPLFLNHERGKQEKWFSLTVSLCACPFIEWGFGTMSFSAPQCDWMRVAITMGWYIECLAPIWGNCLGGSRRYALVGEDIPEGGLWDFKSPPYSRLVFSLLYSYGSRYELSTIPLSDPWPLQTLTLWNCKAKSNVFFLS